MEQVANWRDLLETARQAAWNSQHQAAIDACTQALSQIDLDAAAQLDVLDTRAESLIVQGNLKAAARDAALMVKLANAEKKPSLRAQALNCKAHLQILQGKAPGAVRTAASSLKAARQSKDARLAAQALRLSNQAAVTLENAIKLEGLEQRMVERTSELEQGSKIQHALFEIAESAIDARDMYDFYSKVHQIINSLMLAKSFFIAEYNDQTGLVSWPYFIDETGDVPDPPLPLKDFRGGTAYVVRTGNTMHNLVDFERLVREGEMELVGVRPVDWIGVALKVGDKILGALVVQSYAPEVTYTDQDVQVLTFVAQHFATALTRARAIEAIRQRNYELSIINMIQQGLDAELDFQSIVDLVGDKLSEVLNTHDLGIRWYDEKTDLVHYLYQYEHGNRLTFPPARLHFDFSPDQAESRVDVPIVSGVSKLVIETRRPVIWNTMEEGDAIAPNLPGTDAGKSGIAIPIISKDHVVGSIQLENHERENVYGESELRLLTTIATSLGAALENARLFDETQRLLKETEQRNAELAIINSVQAALGAELDLQSMVNLVGDKLSELLHTPNLGIRWYDEKTDLVHYLYEYEHGNRLTFLPARLHSDLSPDQAETRVDVPIVSRVLKTVIETRQPVIWNSAEEGDAIAPIIPGTDASKSGVAVPIISKDHILGSIQLEDYERENAYGEPELRLLNTIAASLGAALENARLFDETQRRARETAALAEVGRDISATLDLNKVMERIAAHAKDLLEADDSAIYLPDASGQTFTAIVALGDIVDEIIGDAVQIGEGIIGSLAQSGQAEFINDTESDPRAVTIAGTETQDEERLMIAPLLAGEKVTGMMAVWRTGGSPFNQSELDFLIGLSRQAAVAIENAHLFEVEQQRAVELATINEVSQALASQLETSALIRLAGEQILNNFKADIVYIALLDKEAGLIRFPYMYGETFNTLEYGEGLTSQIIQTGKPLLLNQEVDSRHSEYGVQPVGTAVKSFLGVPMMVGKETIGVISAQSTQEEDRFSEGDLHLLTTIAASLGAAIENARLFAEVQRQKDFSETLVENSPVAIVTSNNQFIVNSWNQGAERLFGYTAEEAIGRHINDLVAYQSDISIEAAAYDERNIRGENIHVITRRCRKDGSLVDVEISATVFVANGQQSGHIIIYHDLSELKRAEAALKEAKAEAEAANQAKSAFLAMMSHEIRTPMNAIIGMSGLLMDTKLDSEQHDFAETVHNSGDALLTIINDILDFSKIEAGKMDLEQQPFDLGECVETALDLMKLKAAEKGLELACEIASDVPAAIVGDVTRLRQVMINLLNNAVKFTEHGEVVLSVSLAKEDTETRRNGDTEMIPTPCLPVTGSNQLLFSLHDTGIGIPPDRLNRLFQAFSQVDASTTRKYGGTGLGLAVSKRLVEMMGGKMWVESEGIPGKGSTFYFTILAETTPEYKPRPSASGMQPDLRGRRVLIVDDNATNRRILTLQTQNWGMLPRAGGSPQEALQWVRQGEPFDLAILDLHIPEMDGITLACNLRSLREAAALPLILLTSLGGNAGEFRSDLFTACLVKPIRPSALFDVLIGIFADQTPQPAQAAPVRPGHDPQMSIRYPLRILLAEDNAVNQKLALRLLSNLGYRADLAANGLEAIQAVEHQLYDVILMDVQMPEMDGLEATRQICARWPDDERPSIIAMTASAMQGDREMCLQAGMNDYVSKPIRMEELIAALERSVQIRRVY